MKSIGFKEWALVCQALGAGEQSVILRKGGIAEGREGFSFQHHEFFLFPTFFHEQLAQVRTSKRSLVAEDGIIRIQFYATVERLLRIHSLPVAEALAPLHILSPEIVRERFDYENSGIEVAFVRTFVLAEPWIFADEKRFGGCRSWVVLPTVPETELNPVLSEEEQTNRRARFEEIVSAQAR